MKILGHIIMAILNFGFMVLNFMLLRDPSSNWMAAVNFVFLFLHLFVMWYHIARAEARVDALLKGE